MKIIGFAAVAPALAFLISSLLLGCGVMSNSAYLNESASFGRTLKILKDPVTNKLSFGAIYTLDSDPDGMSLLFTFKTDISDSELANLPEEIYWNVLGGDGLIAVPATSTASKLPKSSIKIGQIMVKSSYSTARAILSLKDGKLLFGVSPESTLSNPKFNLDVGEICSSSSDLFTNLTNDKKCHEIVESDVGGL